MRATLETVPDKVRELRKLADVMSREGNPYAIEVHALAVDLLEGLNIEREG